jgi:hypothetical protein
MLQNVVFLINASLEETDFTNRNRSLNNNIKLPSLQPIHGDIWRSHIFLAKA